MNTIDAINASFTAQRKASGFDGSMQVTTRNLFGIWQSQLTRKVEANKERDEAEKKARELAAAIDPCKFLHKN